jgi:hypothetical protein
MEENSYMAPRDPEKASANLLRQSLLDSGDGCPGPDILAAYFERSLDRQQSARYELHLSRCSCCREQLAALDRASGAPSAIRRQRHGTWLWDWRWLAPVAAVLILAAVWILRRPLARQEGKTEQLVAQSRPQEAPLAQEGAKPLPKATTPASAEGSPTHALDKENEKPARDARLAAGKLTPAPAVSQNAGVPLTPPLEKGSPAPTENPRQVTATEQTPSPMEAKSNPTSAAARVSAERVKTGMTLAANRVTLRMIPTPNPKVVWRIGGGAGVERSEDGGASWQLAKASTQLTAGSAPSEKICWVVGRDGVIFLTANAKDWEPIPPPVPVDFVAITALDLSSATVTTADGRKFTTNDGGMHWNPAP